jgi:peptidoglycan/xylan/chitin deacetylase (PgdA/CDA1 family)
MPSRLLHLLTIPFILIACNAQAVAAPGSAETVAPPSPTNTITPSATITPTPAPSATATPTWVAQGPDHVLVPILLFHHIGISPDNGPNYTSPYYVPPDRFEDEVRLLRNWDYTAITTSALVGAITRGAKLPPRPILFTFDDANEDNYTNAFPIMKKYGFTGVLYLPYEYIGAPDYLTVDQIKEMAASGWEIGSHTLTHPLDFLTLSPAAMRAEVVDSRKKLAALLGVPILTFAYPFGDVNSAAGDYVHFAGYIAAMDAKGFTADQGRSNLFALQREEVGGREDAKTFIRFLPWLGDPSFLPTDTPTPTPRPTRTPVPTYTQYPTRTPKASLTP